jgi:hypothetical protein
MTKRASTPAVQPRIGRRTGGAGGRTGPLRGWAAATPVEASTIGALAGSDAGASTGLLPGGPGMAPPGARVERNAEAGCAWATSTSQRSQIRTLEAESRSAGFFVSSAVSSASNGPARRIGRGSSSTTAASVRTKVPLSKGGWPSTAKNMVAPSAHTSAAGATWPPLSLLRRHVGGRAERQRGRRELWDTLERGDAKAGQPHPTVVPHHHVGRLDITVDDPGAVGGLQHTRHLSAELGHSRRR